MKEKMKERTTEKKSSKSSRPIRLGEVVKVRFSPNNSERNGQTPSGGPQDPQKRLEEYEAGIFPAMREFLRLFNLPAMRREIEKPGLPGYIARAAAILAAVELPPEECFELLLKLDLLEEDSLGPLYYNGRHWKVRSLPMKYYGEALRKLRLAAAEVSRRRREELIEEERFLSSLSEISPQELIEGKKGRCFLQCPFEEKGGKKFYPGTLLLESDGEKIFVLGGTRGCRKLALQMEERGLFLKVKYLQNKKFFSSRAELGILTILHRRIWSALGTQRSKKKK